MSLLLDALKKAAQDKIARSDSGAPGVPADEGRDDREAAPGEAAAPDTAAHTSKDISTREDAEPGTEEVEFTLDEVPDEAVAAHVADARAAKAAVDAAALATTKHAIAEKASIAALHTTVTDEALQLLIHKSNVEHRKRQYVVWGSVISGSVLILVLAGLYFYTDMNDEIVAMQSKNRQALAALEAQTRIEEHLTSLATVVAKPAQNKPETIKRTTSPKPPVEQATTQKQTQKQTFTVRKTEKHDPINVLLNRGWTSFQRGDYDAASKAYNDVLQRDARNRDALLGVAAVAGKRGETEKAREYYLELLQLDPLDPYAHAGLASIAQTEGASLSEDRLRQLIEKQPDSAHLRFVLGNLYAGQDKWPQAQQAYFSAWQGDSENADYAFNLAVSLDHLKKYNEAERFYLSSLDLAQNKNTGFSTDAVEKRLQQLRAVKK